MHNRKTTVNLTEENYQKMQEVIQTTQISQTEFLNKAVSAVPIVNLGSQRTLAEVFFDLRCACNSGGDENIRREVDRACRSLSLLMEKIEELKH